MAYSYEPMREEHGPQVLAVLNHHIASASLPTPASPCPPPCGSAFSGPWRAIPLVVKHDDQVVGFGALKPFLLPDTLQRTAEISYFILPDHTGQGLGSRCGDAHRRGQAKGIDNLLANVSSQNPGSLRFHQRHGFKQWATSPSGAQVGQGLDLVWLQSSSRRTKIEGCQAIWWRVAVVPGCCAVWLVFERKNILVLARPPCLAVGFFASSFFTAIFFISSKRTRRS